MVGRRSLLRFNPAVRRSRSSSPPDLRRDGRSFPSRSNRSLSPRRALPRKEQLPMLLKAMRRQAKRRDAEVRVNTERLQISMEKVAAMMRLADLKKEITILLHNMLISDGEQEEHKEMIEARKMEEQIGRLGIIDLQRRERNKLRELRIIQALTEEESLEELLEI